MNKRIVYAVVIAVVFLILKWMTDWHSSSDSTPAVPVSVGVPPAVTPNRPAETIVPPPISKSKKAQAAKTIVPPETTPTPPPKSNEPGKSGAIDPHKVDHSQMFEENGQVKKRIDVVDGKAYNNGSLSEPLPRPTN